MQTSNGHPLPLGPSRTKYGHNFSLFSANASGVEIHFYKPGTETSFAKFPLNQTESTWHIEVSELPETFEYTFSVEGPHDGKHLFDASKRLLDPRAPMTNSPHTWGETPRPLRGKIEETQFDWEGDAPLNLPLHETIIYEMHVRAFTADPSSGISNGGTYEDIIDKIPHLQKLGVTAVELMPIYEFNERSHRFFDSNDPLYNFWGYSTVSFFAPMNRFARKDASTELKNLIKSMHKAGIEVLLDVVYNHTNEGDSTHYYESFRGVDNASYYMLTDDGHYYNYSGCGNTVNCNHPAVTDFIVDSLIHWVTEYHIDGFRFDLASILTRGEDGTPLNDPPLIKALCEHPKLSSVKLIAEAWDCGGLYQVGSFPCGSRFSEWNGVYRDTVRRYIKGNSSEYDAFKDSFLGSPKIYPERGPLASINFITAHDGFTMYDLTAYNEKHNEMNREENCDGHGDNESWNCGVEGETTDKTITSLREKQVQNFLATLFLSRGVPMMLMGDEYAHTRYGNNNAWCHDNFLNYFNWDKAQNRSELIELVGTLTSLRKQYCKKNSAYDVLATNDPSIFCCIIDNALFFAINISDTKKEIAIPNGYEIIIGTKNFQEGLLPHASLIAVKNRI